MPENIKIRLGGYSPPDSRHSLAAVHFNESPEKQLGKVVTVDLFWNVLDFGYRADDLLSIVEFDLLNMLAFPPSLFTERTFSCQKISRYA